MRTKNAKPATPAERIHMLKVKMLPCACCGQAGPSEAHHIEQGLHFTTIPLCPDCHRGSHNGLHGGKAIWRVRKVSELDLLNDTVRRLTNE